MNPIARMMKRYIKMPLKYALPLLFIGALVLISTTGCISVTPGHGTPNAPTGAGTNYDVSISAREVTSITSAYGSLFKKATPGNKLVAIECSLKNNNVANLFTVWREWTAKDASGTLYQFNANVDLISNGYPKTTIQPGDTAKGIIPYEIPINAKIVSMRYTDETTGTHTLTCKVTAGSSSTTLAVLPIVTGTPILARSATPSATASPTVKAVSRGATKLIDIQSSKTGDVYLGDQVVTTGRLVDANGNGIPNQQVTFRASEPIMGTITQGSATTDSTGRFQHVNTVSVNGASTFLTSTITVTGWVEYAGNGVYLPTSSPHVPVTVHLK